MGPTYQKHQRRLVQYSECGVEVAEGLLRMYHQSQHGVEKGCLGGVQKPDQSPGSISTPPCAGQIFDRGGGQPILPHFPTMRHVYTVSGSQWTAPLNIYFPPGGRSRSTYHITEEEVREGAETALTVYGISLALVSYFNYLGLFLLASDENLSGSGLQLHTVAS